MKKIMLILSILCFGCLQAVTIPCSSENKFRTCGPLIKDTKNVEKVIVATCPEFHFYDDGLCYDVDNEEAKAINPICPESHYYDNGLCYEN